MSEAKNLHYHVAFQTFDTSENGELVLVGERLPDTVEDEFKASEFAYYAISALCAEWNAIHNDTLRVDWGNGLNENPASGEVICEYSVSLRDGRVYTVKVTACDGEILEATQDENFVYILLDDETAALLDQMGIGGIPVEPNGYVH